MSDWRKAIAEFKDPNGASIVVIRANDKVEPKSVVRTLHTYIDPNITVLICGSLRVVAPYIANHMSLYKHAWHICTANYYPRKKVTRPTERMTMVGVFSAKGTILYTPEKVLDAVKLEREYPSNVILVNETVGHIPDDVIDMLISCYSSEIGSPLKLCL